MDCTCGIALVYKISRLGIQMTLPKWAISDPDKEMLFKALAVAIEALEKLKGPSGHDLGDTYACSIAKKLSPKSKGSGKANERMF